MRQNGKQQQPTEEKKNNEDNSIARARIKLKSLQ